MLALGRLNILIGSAAGRRVQIAVNVSIWRWAGLVRISALAARADLQRHEPDDPD
jgi:hypothetical protein